jgi:hypothetical protein
MKRHVSSHERYPCTSTVTLHMKEIVVFCKPKIRYMPCSTRLLVVHGVGTKLAKRALGGTLTMLIPLL